MKEKTKFEKLMDDVHYLIVAHCKYKDMSMYDRALKQFQKDINYEQLEEMSYDERFAFLLGFETSLKTVEAIALKDGNKTMMKPRKLDKPIEVFNNMIGKRRKED